MGHPIQIPSSLYLYDGPLHCKIKLSHSFSWVGLLFIKPQSIFQGKGIKTKFAQFHCVQIESSTTNRPNGRDLRFPKKHFLQSHPELTTTAKGKVHQATTSPTKMKRSHFLGLVRVELSLCPPLNEILDASSWS